MELKEDYSNERYYKVLYGPQCYQYFLSLSLKPTKSVILYDENLSQVRRIESKDVVYIQRRITVSNATGREAAGIQKDILEIHLSSDGRVTIQFWLPSTQECEDLCTDIQRKLGIPVYSYGNLNLTLKSALDANNGHLGSAERPAKCISKNYELIKDDFYKSCVADILNNLCISDESLEHTSIEPPAQYSTQYPVIIEGALEERSYISFRSVKTPHMPPFSVYKVEWFLSRTRGSATEFHETPSCLSDTFYIRDHMVGHYVMLKVYKAIGNENNRSYLFSTTRKGPIRVCSVMAYSMLLNISKDNEIHNVMVRDMDFSRIAIQLNKYPRSITREPSVLSSNEKPVTTNVSNNTSPLMKRKGLEREEAKDNENLQGEKTDAGISAEGSNSSSSDTRDSDSFTSDLEDGKHMKKGDESGFLPPLPDEAPAGQEEDISHEAPSKDKRKSHSGTIVNDAEQMNEVTRSVDRNGQRMKGNIAATKAVTKGTPTVANDKASSKKPNKFKSLIARVFTKTGKGKVAPIPQKKVVLSQASSTRKKPDTRRATPTESKDGLTKAVEHYVDVKLQNSCKGLKLWTDKIALELPWNRIDLLVAEEPCTDKVQCHLNNLESLLTLNYICKMESEEKVLTLTIKAASYNQRNTLFHSMVFNKYRRHFYTIDQGERDLQLGYYSGVKDSYAKIWKYIGHHNATV